MKNLNKKVKRLDIWDLKLIKLSVVAFTLLILNLWDAARNWIASVHWAWLLAAGVILMLRPLKKYLSK